MTPNEKHEGPDRVKSRRPLDYGSVRAPRGHFETFVALISLSQSGHSPAAVRYRCAVSPIGKNPVMQYHVAFDIARGAPSGDAFTLVPWILVGAGAILVALVLRHGSLPFNYWSQRPILSKAFSFFYFGFALLIAFGSSLTIHHHNRALLDAVNVQHVAIAEGPVTNFKPMPYSGHAMERFCVLAECFEYSDYVITGGFNNTASHGGPIKEGLPVRVTYVGGVIVKLEIGVTDGTKSEHL